MTISKRVAIAVLISLVVLVAAFTSVQALGGAMRKAESRSISVDNHASGKFIMNGVAPQYFSGSMDSDHHCGSDPTVDY
jgi:hypothetical protein